MFNAHFLRLPERSSLSLRDQICELISRGIADDLFPEDQVLPSCRELAGHLSVSRNTVYEAYRRLVDTGLVEAKDRSGYCVSRQAAGLSRAATAQRVESHRTPSPLDVLLSQTERPSGMRKVEHPADWSAYPYPFVYNQIDTTLFPVQEWRESVRVAMGSSTLAKWSGDAGDEDSGNLIRQLQQRLLAYRGIGASPDEILITAGAQNAIYLLGALNARIGGTVAVEDPAYPEARNAFALAGNRVASVPVDSGGLKLDRIPGGTGLVYTTPSHQFPTTVTMPPERREALCVMAERDGFLICEDDYEAEMNFVRGRGVPMRALDTTGRVVYVGSLSKSVAPGLRIGYMVAHPDIIREAKAIRRAVMRHPPGLLQEAMAYFIGSGFLDAHLRRVERRFRGRWEAAQNALSEYMPAFKVQTSQGGSSLWVTGPNSLNSGKLVERLRQRGVLVDEGGVFYANPINGRRKFRLGFAAMPKAAISVGIRIIAEEASR